MKYSVAATAQWFLEGSRKYGAKGFANACASFSPGDLDVNMRSKVACVTGANSGIGYCAAKSLAERNCTVHMLCRNQTRGEEARARLSAETGNKDVFLHVVDVSDFQQVETFAGSFLESNSRLDVLINNAGGMPAERMESAQGHEAIMATMLGGTYLLTKLLLPALEKAAMTAEDSTVAAATSSAEGGADSRPGGGKTGARVINVSSGGMYTVSGAGIAADLDSKGVDPYDGTVVYALAKRAQVTLTERWAALHKDGGVCFNSMHPGWCDTPGLASGMPDFRERQQGSLRSSEEGSDTIVWLACSRAAFGETGKFWFDRKATRTHMPLAGTRMSQKEEDDLWEAVERACSER
ncbi:unnamed protein product [Ectocarpus sp. 12 AP-2014]